MQKLMEHFYDFIIPGKKPQIPDKLLPHFHHSCTIVANNQASVWLTLLRSTTPPLLTLSLSPFFSFLSFPLLLLLSFSPFSLSLILSLFVSLSFFRGGGDGGGGLRHRPGASERGGALRLRQAPPPAPGAAAGRPEAPVRRPAHGPHPRAETLSEPGCQLDAEEGAIQAQLPQR